MDVLAADGDEQALGLELGPAAVRADVLDHDLAQIVLHPRVRRLLLSMVAVAALDVVGDPVVTKEFAHVLIAARRALRQDQGKPLTLRAGEKNRDRRIR